MGNACGGKSSEVPSGSAGGDAAYSAKGGSGGAGGHVGGRGGAGGGRAGHGAGRAGSGGGTGGVMAGAGGEPDGAAGESGQSSAGESVGARGGSGGGGASGEAGAGGEGHPPEPVKLADGVCPDAAVWSPGAEQCGDGSFIHRIQALGCPLPARDPEDLPPEAGHDQDDDIELEAHCYTDKDCGPGGYCVRGYDQTDFNPVQYCITPCASDADCGAREACLCQPERRNASKEVARFGACRPATCLQDDDCGTGKFCRAPLRPISCVGDAPFPTRLQCQTPADECSGGDECPRPEYSDQTAICEGSDSGALVCGIQNEC